MVFEAACGLLNHGPSRFDRKRGQRELAGEFSETDFESEVFEFACKLGLPALQAGSPPSRKRL